MIKIFEYECRSGDCSKLHQAVEKLHQPEDTVIPSCDECKKELFKVFSATRGYVTGSRNRTRQ